MTTQETIPRIRRKVFCCPDAGRMVSVEFAEVGPPFFRRPVKILSCSAFEHPSQISCSRQCLDPVFRQEIGRGLTDLSGW